MLKTHFIGFIQLQHLKGDQYGMDVQFLLKAHHDYRPNHRNIREHQSQVQSSNTRLSDGINEWTKYCNWNKNNYLQINHIRNPN